MPSISSLYNRLPVIRELRDIRQALWAHSEFGEATLGHLRKIRIAQRLSEPGYSDPRHLNRFEHQVYSQNGEDGIIAEILKRLDVRAPGLFAEIGVGNGLENNTGYLLAQGWKGLWVEGNPGNVSQIRRGLHTLISNGTLGVIEAFVTRENVAEHLQQVAPPHELDFLSIDVDQNTFWIWDGLRSLSPKVVAVEYSSDWPPGVDWTVEYDPKSVWDGSFAFGASLSAFTRLGKELGYSLVACDLAGVNAFFVRTDLITSRFAGPFEADTFYQPPDYLLTSPAAGLRRGFAGFFGRIFKP